jgi:hypothetical protein
MQDFFAEGINSFTGPGGVSVRTVAAAPSVVALCALSTHAIDEEQLIDLNFSRSNG